MFRTLSFFQKKAREIGEVNNTKIIGSNPPPPLLVQGAGGVLGCFELGLI